MTTPPLRTLLWNRPSSEQGLDQIVRVGVRYPWRPENDAADAKWSWGNVTWRFTLGGRDVAPGEVVAQLRKVRAISFENFLFWKTFTGDPDPLRPLLKCPHPFIRESVACTQRIIREIRSALIATPMTAAEVHGLDLIFDLEDWSLSASQPEEAAAKPFGKSIDSVRVGCYVLTTAMAECGWVQREGAAAVNFACSNGTERILCGGGNDRFTPAPCPAALDGRSAFFAAYGDAWQATEDEHLDMIAKAPAGSVLAIAMRTPGLLNVLARARASGKFRLVLVWDDGIALEHRAKLDAAISETARGNA